MITIITTITNTPSPNRDHVICSITLHRVLEMYTGTQEILAKGDGNDDNETK